MPRGKRRLAHARNSRAGRTFHHLFNGRELFRATDGTIAGPRRTGLWTKADSVTWFGSIRIQSLD